MPFISADELDRRLKEARDHGRELGAADGYEKGAQDVREASAARSPYPISGVPFYCGNGNTGFFSGGLIPSHLDALDLVIDQFNLRDHYPKAQGLYDDLKAAKEFNDKADAAARIAHAVDIASSGFDDDGFSDLVR